ncbi:YtxH domain-containing protein [Clostridium paraputrificum]|uniref:YtxH domain-containing protein n=1 Tax=Clostridium TaxID=1485 RepID=UPI003D352F56
MGKCINGMAAGMLIGAAVGMMLLPQLDRRKQRAIRKAGQKLFDFAGDSYDDIMGMIH